MKEAESKGEILQNELKSLEYQEKNTFKSPPTEWIDHRLEEFYETLSENTTASALALKEVLGEVRMEAVVDGVFSPEYIINGVASSGPSAPPRNDGGNGDSTRVSSPRKDGGNGDSTRVSSPRKDGGNGDSTRVSSPRSDGGCTPFRPYYVAHTKIQTLALLDERHKGSNWYHWRRR